MKPADLWPKLCGLGKEREDWKHHVANQTLQMYTKFFSHFKLIKTEIRSRLSNKGLNSIMRIKMNNLSTVDFNTKYSSQCINYWYNIKERRLGLTKRKKYAPRNSIRTFKNVDVQGSLTDLYVLKMFLIFSKNGRISWGFLVNFLRK